MARLRLLRLPKKPKKTASTAVKERWIQRAKDIQRENARRKADKKKSEHLSQIISNFKAKF